MNLRASRPYTLNSDTCVVANSNKQYQEYIERAKEMFNDFALTWSQKIMKI